VRYDREPPGDERAEYAALVEDRWQGAGYRNCLNPSADRSSTRQRGSVLLRAREGQEYSYARCFAAPGSSRTRTPGG
jgi:hypothetical protein